MANPFMYGRPVSGEFFFSLPKLRDELRTYVDAKINVVIIGPRRFGKTSFVKNLLQNLRQGGKTVIDLDAFGVITLRDFLSQILNAVTKEKSTTALFFDWLKNLPKHKPVIDYEMNAQTGLPAFSISLQKIEEEDVKQAILHCLDGLRTLGKDVVVSIDEFQQIAQLDDGGWLEATLRSKMQEHSELSFIFTGSRRSLLEEMFNSPKRPFFHSCKIIYFPHFGPDFSEWLRERFAKAGVECDRDTLTYLRSRVNDTPHYVQEICFHLVSQGLKKIEPPAVDEVINIISSQSFYSYEALLNTLTSAQKKLLRMIVLEGKVEYSKNMRARYEFKTPSAIQAALKSLNDKQIIEVDPATKEVRFDDSMFRIWMNNKLRK